jgi:hypothetical protein
VSGLYVASIRLRLAITSDVSNNFMTLNYSEVRAIYLQLLRQRVSPPPANVLLFYFTPGLDGIIIDYFHLGTESL